MNTPSTPSLLELVASVRADTLLGEGTGSMVDDCYSDDELVDLFAANDIRTVMEARREARLIEIRSESHSGTKSERYAHLLVGGHRGNILMTDGYKFAMAQAGFPLRKEVFYLHFRKGEPLYIPFDLEEIVRRLVPNAPSDNQKQFLEQHDYGLTPAMVRALEDPLTIHAQKEGTWANPNEPVITIEGPSFLVSWLEPLLIALQFPMQIATAIQNGVRSFTATCNDEGRIIFLVAEALGYDVVVDIEVKAVAYVEGLRERLEKIRTAVGGNIGRVFEVGTRSMTCIQQHLVCLTLCKEFGIQKTANVFAAYQLQMYPVGTTGHEHQQRHGKDIDGFRAIRDCRARPPAYLFDTYNPYQSGISAVIQMFNGTPNRTQTIRFDSGDQEKQLQMLWQRISPWVDVRYIFMDGYDAERIVKMESFARKLRIPEIFCIYGVGGYLTVDPAISPYNRNTVAMVYKLCQTDGRPTRKYSGDLSKSSLAGYPVVRNNADGVRTICQVWEIAFDSKGLLTSDSNYSEIVSSVKPTSPTLSSNCTLEINRACLVRDMEST